MVRAAIEFMPVLSQRGAACYMRLAGFYAGRVPDSERVARPAAARQGRASGKWLRRFREGKGPCRRGWPPATRP